MKRTVIALCTLLVACESDDEQSNADLPTGWENADRVTEFMQMECPGAVGGDPFEEAATFTPGIGSVHVDYQDAYFRCEQDVEGFALYVTGQLELLVQPVDMDPEEVAGCDCLYHIVMDVDDLPAGELGVSLDRRGDNMNPPNDAVPIASRTVTIE